MANTPKPKTREELIKLAKTLGVLTDEGSETHKPSEMKILGYHVYNESNAKVYVANIDGVLVIFVEPKLLTTEIMA
jgi:hypothetical protein